jgi:Ras-related protein Rab-37
MLRRFEGIIINCDSQFVAADDSISDDVFEMDDERSSTITNALSGGLAAGERTLDKTPSPTGYRDYKPPVEVLGNNYATTFRTTSDFDNVRSTLKRDQEKEDNFAHKVS